MVENHNLSIEDISQRLDRIEDHLVKNFSLIHAHLKEQTDSLRATTESLTNLESKVNGTTSKQPIEDNNKIKPNLFEATLNQFETIKENFFAVNNLEYINRDRNSALGRELEEFLVRAKLVFNKKKTDLETEQIHELLTFMAQQFPNISNTFRRINDNEKKLVDQINHYYTGNIYQGAWTKDFLIKLFDVLSAMNKK